MLARISHRIRAVTGGKGHGTNDRMEVAGEVRPPSNRQSAFDEDRGAPPLTYRKQIRFRRRNEELRQKRLSDARSR
jgi:hypothetical protein